MVEKPTKMGSKQAWKLLLVLLLGQLTSLLAAVANFSSSYIADLGVDTPLTQCLLMYLSLAVFYGSILVYRRQKLMVSWYWYVILAFINVQGNYMVVKAYQYSPITSVVLLYSWIVPWSMILTWFLLRTRYSPWHFVGAAICVVGFMLVLVSKASSGVGKNPLLGNTLVVAGTLCSALSIVGEEFCVKKKDRVEVVAMLGVFSALVCACQISIFERKDLASVKWSPLMIALFAGYSAASFLTSTLAPFILKISGTTLFFLSLLTCNAWAVLIRIFFYREQVHWSYYVAFSIVAVGIVIYSLNDTASSTATNIVDAEAAIHYEPLPEETPSESLAAS